MPRAPHSSALLAGSPRAKRRVLSTSEIAHPVDAAQQRDVDAVDARDRRERAAVGAPDEGVGGGEIGRGSRGGREPLQRVGDAGEEVGLALERRQVRTRFD